MQILYYLESIRTPFWNTILGGITYLGDETFVIALFLFIYWCVSKKWGCYTLIVMFFSQYINLIAKIFCRVSRPWVEHPDFTIVESARARAEGYSFPSGHVANIVGGLGSLARFEKKLWVSAVCVVLILAVSFSRMYLGVHYPSDVVFSLIAGVILVFGLYSLYSTGDHVSRRIRISFYIMTVLAALFMFYMRRHVWPADIQLENLVTARKNCYLMVGLCLGMVVGILFDNEVLDFSVQAPWWAQIIKTVVGLVLVLGVKSLLKLILPDELWWTCPRYFVTAVFATCVWPMTFPWIAGGCGLIHPETEAEE